MSTNDATDALALAIEQDLDEVMASPLPVHMPSLEPSASAASDPETPTHVPITADFSNLEAESKAAEPQKGKKNARFGRNPDGTPAKKADKKEVERKSEWGRFLHDFKARHPDLAPLEATIEARKVYVPESGKQKSFERIFTEVWKTRNPRWPKMDKAERLIAIRAAFVKII